MKEEKLPKSIGVLPEAWQDVFRALPPLAGYRDFCALFGYKNAKSASAALNADPDAPPVFYISREARFDRQALVLWAYHRAVAARRGRKSAPLRSVKQQENTLS